MTNQCDVLIIGAGPAGLRAAHAAAASGARIVLVDDNPVPGGQIWRDGPGVKLPPVARGLRATVESLPNVQILTGTRVVASAGKNAERALLLENRTAGWVQHFDKLILCTGARELLLPLPGWTLAGVTGAGALQALIKSGLPVRGQRIVVAGTGPLLLAAAAAARHAGAEVVCVAEAATWLTVLGFAAALPRWPSKLGAAGALGLGAFAAYRAGAQVVEILGDDQVAAVRLRLGSVETELACDRVAIGFGLVPNTELGQLLGVALNPADAIAVNAAQQTCLPHVYAAGECTGIGGNELAQVEGTIAGLMATSMEAGDARIGAVQPELRRRAHWQAFAIRVAAAFPPPPLARQLPRADSLVCRCEDVPYAALAACDNWVQAKLETRCGMGACQGRVCGAATRFLFGWNPTAPRHLLAPARLATLAARPISIN